MLPTSVATFRIWGEPKRWVIAWISGSVSRANASSCVQVTLAPTERTSRSRVICRQLAQARETQERRRLEPALVPLDAQLGAAGDDDRTRVSCPECDGVFQPLQGGRKPSGSSRSGAEHRPRGQLFIHHARRIEARQPPEFRAIGGNRQTGFEDGQITGASAEVAGEARPQIVLVHRSFRTRRRPPSRRRTPACRIRIENRDGRSSPAGWGSGRRRASGPRSSRCAFHRAGKATGCRKPTAGSGMVPASGTPTRTVQAPQSPSAQPTLVPTRPLCSRRNSTRVEKAASPAIAIRFPFR